VETPSATYLYDKEGAGFVSILDADGQDWIGWSQEAGSAGAYRGLPNLGPCCHPGYEGARTVVDEATEEGARIRSTGTDGATEWEVMWEFELDHATLTVVKAPAAYYLLYEGTPGGRLGSEDSLLTSSGPSSRMALPSASLEQDLPAPEWVLFEDEALARGLLLVHHEDDAIGDRYWTMDGVMTVFGFGRTCRGACWGLSAAPQHLSVAFIDDATFAKASARARALLDAR
jgi:hypothetical protein